MPTASLPDNLSDMVDMDLESLAFVLLTYLKGQRDNPNNLNRYNIANGAAQGKDQTLDNSAKRALLEAWSWLESRGLVAPDAYTTDVFFVTRLGWSVQRETDLQGLVNAKLLPRELLHSKLHNAAWPAFIRGDLDTAVFSAFKAVEIAVREAGTLPPEAIGVPLMREAFDPNDGPLRDVSAVASEREAIAHLFAGAAGYFRNPTAHRDVHLTNSIEAVEMLMFASHLLRIVDGRT